ncbi:hypothetical protein V8C86DRAFT_2586965 [Haematococcus lacustris]
MDASVVERQDRQRKKEDMYEKRRVANYHREVDFAQRNEQAHQRAEGVYERKREAGQGGSRRNASSQAYNILTLDYAPTPDGQALKQKVRHQQPTRWPAAVP